MSEHFKSKLGLGSGAEDVTDTKFYGATSGEKAETKKLGLKEGGHAMDKHCKPKKKMAMGGVGKERLGQY